MGLGVSPPAPNFTGLPAIGTASENNQSTALLTGGAHRSRSPTPLPQEAHHLCSRSITPLPGDLLHPASANAIAQPSAPVVSRAPSEGFEHNDQLSRGSGRISRSHSPVDVGGAQPISLKHVRATIAVHHAAQPEPQVRWGSHSDSNSRAVTPSIDPTAGPSNPMPVTSNPPPQITTPTPPSAGHVPATSNPPPPAAAALPPVVAETYTGGGCSTHKSSRAVALPDLPESQQVLVPAMRVALLFHIVAYEAWPVQSTPVLEKALEYAKSIPHGIPVAAVTLDEPFKKHVSSYYSLLIY